MDVACASHDGINSKGFFATAGGNGANPFSAGLSGTVTPGQKYNVTFQMMELFGATGGAHCTFYYTLYDSNGDGFDSPGYNFQPPYACPGLTGTPADFVVQVDTNRTRDRTGTANSIDCYIGDDSASTFIACSYVEVALASVDWPVTGASSATMSGASSRLTAFTHTSAGSVTMTGEKVADITRVVPTVVPSASGSGRTPGTIVLSDDTPLPGDTITLTFQPGPGARITEVTLDGVTQSGTYGAVWAALMPGVAWSRTYEVPEDTPPVISGQFTEAANGGSISYAPGGFLAGSAVEDFALRAANMEDLRKKKYESL
jgi:hypothetical protein